MAGAEKSEPIELSPVPAAEIPRRARGLAFGQSDVRVVSGKGRARPVAEIGILPKAVDVVIVGGGMVGTMAALTLAERGVSVLLCEKGVLAGEASGRAMGLIYTQYADPSKGELAARSKHLWSQIPQRVEGETGYRARGHLAAIESDEALAATEAWIESMHDAPGFDSRIISAAEVQERVPMMRSPPEAALFTPSDGAAEPVLAVPAIAESARARGAIILQNCSVRALETSAGRISGVVTERGAVACQSVIIAAGAWTPRFMRHLGVSLAQAEIHMSMAELAVPSQLTQSFAAQGYGVRRQHNGRYSFGAMSFAVPITPGVFRNMKALLPLRSLFKSISRPGLAPSEFWRELVSPAALHIDRPSVFESRRVAVPAYNYMPFNAALDRLKVQVPEFAQASVTEYWGGIMSTTLDGMPVISDVPSVPGLLVGSGFINGFTFGTAAGEALADLATGRAAAIDLTDYHISRFSGGIPTRYRM